MKRFLHWLLIIWILVGWLVNVPMVNAQSSGSNWVGPYRISKIGNKTIGAGTLHGMEGVAVTTDQNGIAHVFWRELDEENRMLIQYARFDGANWSIPINIFSTAPEQAIGFLSAAVDLDGRLYLVWGTAPAATSPVYISQVPASEAYRVQSWTHAVETGIMAFQMKLRIDSKGTLHLVYSQIHDADPGIYYSRSEDKGKTWSYSVWLDSDILKNYVPWSLQFDLDSSDGLHVAWYYYSYEVTGDWIRYVHSFSGGKDWISPVTIDRVGGNPDKDLTFASPVMAVKDKTIMVVWAGGNGLYYRNYGLSSDGGITWTQPIHIFGELNGQAGDGIVADASGRFYFFSQIRYPQGIWQADWMDGKWTTPFLIYLMTQTPDVPLVNRLNVHDTHPAIVVGNVLLLLFFDREGGEGTEPLYAMHRVLEEIPSSRPDNEQILVEPGATSTQTPAERDIETEIMVTPFEEKPSSINELSSTGPTRPTTVGHLILIGILPSALFIVLFLLNHWKRARGR